MSLVIWFVGITMVATGLNISGVPVGARVLLMLGLIAMFAGRPRGIR